MEVEITSLVASVVALAISLMTVVRTRKAFEITRTQNEYVLSPKLSLSNMELYIFDDAEEKPAFEFSASVTSHSQNTVKISGIYLEWGSKDNSDARIKEKLMGPVYIADKETKSIETSASNWHMQKASDKYGLSEVYYWLTIVVNGIYGEEVITRYYLLHRDIEENRVLTRCPHKEYAI